MGAPEIDADSLRLGIRRDSKRRPHSALVDRGRGEFDPSATTGAEIAWTIQSTESESPVSDDRKARIEIVTGQKFLNEAVAVFQFGLGDRAVRKSRPQHFDRNAATAAEFASTGCRS